MIWILIICAGCNESIIIDNFKNQKLCLEAAQQIDNYTKNIRGLSYHKEDSICIPVKKEEK